MVIMERSRSPVRPPTSTREPGHLVGFPVWQRPMGSGAPVPPPRQYPSTFSWNQQSSNNVAPPEVPLSQQSMMVPPGQPGLSQQSMGMSQVQGDLSQPCPSPLPSWRSSQCGVQGCGMAGMMQPFPPPPPSWGHQSGWHRPTQYGQNTPTPPRMPSPSTSGSTIPRRSCFRGQNNFRQEVLLYNMAKIGSLTRSSMTPRRSMDCLFQELSVAPVGANSRTLRDVTLLVSLSASYFIKEAKTSGFENLLLEEKYMWLQWEKWVKWCSWVRSCLKFEAVVLTLTDLHNTKLFKMAKPWTRKMPSTTLQNNWWIKCRSGSQWFKPIQDPNIKLQPYKLRLPSSKQKQIQPLKKIQNLLIHHRLNHPGRVQSPLEAAFQGHRPVAFDPAQLLVTPGGTNQWLENNMPEAFSDAKYKAWYKGLKLDITSRQTVERNIVAMDNWWQNQPDTAESTIHRVAVCSGISPSKIKSGQNENLLKVLTVALTMTA